MKYRKIIFPLAALAAAAALMVGLWYFTLPKTHAGGKTIAVEVVHGDQTAQEFSYKTQREYLGEVLVDEGLISGEKGPYGLFITVADGEEAQDSLRQWWCITKGGERVDTSVDSTPIADGDHFELTLSIY